jgi:2-polyprenyl-6-methoxyphenol hydroxylase-like FAD-dependent oxidoreductase
MVGVLDRLGVLDEVLALGCPPLAREFFYEDGAPDGVEDGADEPGEVGYCLSVRREPLDAILLDRARRSPTVEVAEGAGVVDLAWDDGRVAGVVLAEGRTVGARFVVGADGRNSLVARKAGAPAEEQSPGTRALYYRYVAGFVAPDGGPPDAAEFSLRGDELAYVFPSDAGLTCVAVSVDLDTFRRVRGDVEAGYAERLAAHRAIAPRLAGSTVAGRVLGSGPQRNYVRVPHGPGWALVGDAAIHQDPWSGRGMDTAGVGATFLADALLEALGRADDVAALARYHERRNEHALDQYRTTVRYACDLRQLASASGQS